MITIIQDIYAEQVDLTLQRLNESELIALDSTSALAARHHSFVFQLASSLLTYCVAE
jgi:hypothetical protein